MEQKQKTKKFVFFPNTLFPTEVKTKEWRSCWVECDYP